MDYREKILETFDLNHVIKVVVKTTAPNDLKAWYEVSVPFADFERRFKTIEFYATQKDVYGVWVKTASKSGRFRLFIKLTSRIMLRGDEYVKHFLKHLDTALRDKYKNVRVSEDLKMSNDENLKALNLKMTGYENGIEYTQAPPEIDPSHTENFLRPKKTFDLHHFKQVVEDGEVNTPRANDPATPPTVGKIQDLSGWISLGDVDFSKLSNLYITKDSGKRDVFETGSVRDTQDGKPRYDLIPVEALRRVADLYARGAKKYNDHNWKKGQPFSRTYASLLRHVFAWAEGERTEDHLAGVIFNAMALMFYEEKIASGELPDDLKDM